MCISSSVIFSRKLATLLYKIVSSYSFITICLMPSLSEVYMIFAYLDVTITSESAFTSSTMSLCPVRNVTSN